MSKKCEYCDSMIPDEAFVCPFCNAKVEKNVKFTPAPKRNETPKNKAPEEKPKKKSGKGKRFLAFLLTVLMQGVPVLPAVVIALRGYAPGGALAEVLSGGGFFSMVGTMLLLLFAGGCTGIIGGMELLKPAKDFLKRISARLGRYPTMVIASVASCMIFCNQTIAMIFCKELMEDVYTDATHQEFAADISCSVVTIAGLIPWCIACSVPLSMLGAGFDALPYACYLYLIPICYFFTKRLFFPNKEKAR